MFSQSLRTRSLPQPRREVWYGLCVTTHGTTLAKSNVGLMYLEKAVKDFEKQAKLYMEEQNKQYEGKNELVIRELNDRIVNVEKSFIYSGALPKRPRVRYLLFGPSFDSYGTTDFPGLSDLLNLDNKNELLDWPEIKKQISVIYISVLKATKTLKGDKKHF